MKKSAMPEVKFAKRERQRPTDGQIIEQLGKANKQLIDKVDELRELLDERNARVKALETKNAVMEHEIARYLHELYISDERTKELETLIARMDEIANNDSYAEKLSEIAAGVDADISPWEDEDDPAGVETVSWHPGPCPECGEPVSGEAILTADIGAVYHPNCIGIKIPQPEPIVWCSCKDDVGAGTCPTCGGEKCPF